MDNLGLKGFTLEGSNSIIKRGEVGEKRAWLAQRQWAESLSNVVSLSEFVVGCCWYKALL